jgi:uncharacterized membrane protein YoaK (UPF0700 family)
MILQLREAWHTLVPARGDAQGPLPPVLVALTVVTGLVDAFSYLMLGHVFTANMTGNVVFLAFSLAGAAGFSVWASLVSIGAFVVGALVGGRITHRFAAHRGRLIFAAVGLQMLLVVIAFVVARLVHAPYVGGHRAVLIILIAAAMGIQNAASRALGVPDLTTTVLTLTITGIAADSRLAGGTNSRAGRRIVSALSMFVGALVGAVLVGAGIGSWAIAVAAVVLLMLTVTGRALARSHHKWVKAA